MPQSEQDHRNDQGEISPPHLAAQNRQWEKNIVANPERQRHVPVRPEDRRRCGLERTRKVLGQGKAQHFGGADGNVRITSEIEEKLQSVSKRQTPDVRATPAGEVIETSVDPVAVAGQNPLPQQLGQLHHQDACGDAAASRACGRSVRRWPPERTPYRARTPQKTDRAPRRDRDPTGSSLPERSRTRSPKAEQGGQNSPARREARSPQSPGDT